jgi:hypothetical protein
VPLLTVVHPFIKPMYSPPSSSPTPTAVPIDDVSYFWAVMFPFLD